MLCRSASCLGSTLSYWGFPEDKPHALGLAVVWEGEADADVGQEQGPRRLEHPG